MRSIIAWVLAGAVALTIVITLIIIATDTESFDPIHGSDCINVTWTINELTGTDENRSGIYCPEVSK